MDGQFFTQVKPPLKIAILGCGYVGTAFALQAQTTGHQVLGIVRSEASVARLAALGVSAQAHDLFASDWAPLPEAFDLVIYAASTGGSGVDAYALTYDVGVRRALAWAREVGAKTFIFTSSTGVYRQDDGSVVDEDSPVGGTPTADAILAGERAVLAAGFPRAYVLRFGGLYGPGRHYLVDQLKRGETVIGGRVDHFINYLHREDAAAAMLAAALSDAPSGVYNLTDGQPLTKAELAVWICAQLKITPPVFDAAAPAGPRVRRTGQVQPSRRVNSARAGQALGWQPIYPNVFKGLAEFLR